MPQISYTHSKLSKEGIFLDIMVGREGSKRRTGEGEGGLKNRVGEIWGGRER